MFGKMFFYTSVVVVVVVGGAGVVGVVVCVPGLASTLCNPTQHLVMFADGSPAEFLTCCTIL